MREHTVTAVLIAIWGDLEISPAFLPQSIKGAVAEKTVEVIGVTGLVTGEKLTVFMIEKRIIPGLFHIFLPFLQASPRKALTQLAASNSLLPTP